MRVKMDAETNLLRARASEARRRAGQASTSQERQHNEGMADYWEELLAEASVTEGEAEPEAV